MSDFYLIIWWVGSFITILIIEYVRLWFQQKCRMCKEPLSKEEKMVYLDCFDCVSKCKRGEL